jgi:hypothetical protein
MDGPAGRHPRKARVRDPSSAKRLTCQDYLEPAVASDHDYGSGKGVSGTSSGDHGPQEPFGVATVRFRDRARDFVSDNAALNIPEAQRDRSRIARCLVLCATTIAGVLDEATPNFVGIPAGRSRLRRGGSDGRLAKRLDNLVGVCRRDRVDEVVDVAEGIGGVTHMTFSKLSGVSRRAISVSFNKFSCSEVLHYLLSTGRSAAVHGSQFRRFQSLDVATFREALNGNGTRRQFPPLTLQHYVGWMSVSRPRYASDVRKRIEANYVLLVSIRPISPLSA